MTLDFAELLREASRQFPSQQAFAGALGVSTARLNRALNKGDYPLNVLNCLKLAKLTGENPSAILRAAGKGDVAELVEALYGEVDSTITSHEREHLRLWRSLSDDARRNVTDTIELLVETAAKKKRKSA